MKSTELIARARSLADIPNSQFITHEDETESLNESYRDIYSALVENDDDYYLEELTFTLTGYSTGDGEYAYPLPADFYKLRFLNYQNGSVWEPVEKFNLRIMNWTNNVVPMYRIKNDTLWIIGNMSATASLRMGYYPPPARVTVPEASIAYGSAVSAASKYLIQSMVYVPTNQTLAYVYNGTTIYAESKTLGTRVTLITGLAQAATQLAYRNGYLYWLQNADIYRAPCDFTTTIVPAKITLTANITTFSIVNNQLYWYNGTDTKVAALDGSGPANYVAGAQRKSISALGTGLVSLTAANAVYVNLASIAAWFAPMITALSTDGVYLYYVEAGNLVRTLLDTTAQTYTSEILAEGVSAAYIPQDDYIPYQALTFDIALLSTLVDTDFAYPANEVNELIAYQCAIDFRRKQQGNTAELEKRYASLYSRFMDVITRDEYRPERIQNFYSRSASSVW